MSSNNYDISALSEFLADGKLDIFNSAYKNLRFNVTMASWIVIDATYEANLPGLSFDTYGTTALWRVILYANGLSDPLNDVVVGKRIGLPDLSSVSAYLLRTRTSTAKMVVI